MPLCSRPETEEDLITAALLKEVSVPIASESAGAVAHAKKSGFHAVGPGYLQFTDVCLLVAKTLMFG
jgi:hypothetical protein